jgi:hypothetical protein
MYGKCDGFLCRISTGRQPAHFPSFVENVVEKYGKIHYDYLLRGPLGPSYGLAHTTSTAEEHSQRFCRGTIQQ